MLLRNGDKGEDVRILQHLLGNRGYFSGIADGIFGGETERAVKAFQIANGLDPDGIVGQGTNAALAKDPSGFTEYLLRKGDKGGTVSNLQRALINAGYSVGSSGADGDFGAGTERAVKAFQKDNYLDSDGIVGPNTWKALSNPSKKHGKTRFLRLGSTGEDVRILQHLLNNRGYDCGIADGIFGGGTERAVKAFQTANRLDPDGIVGPSTDAALAKDPSGFTKYMIRNGDTGTLVKNLQRALVNAGYNVGSTGIDGYFGSGTERAVRKFQSDNNLGSDGIVGPNTWNALDNVGNSRQITRLLRVGSAGEDVRILQHLLNNRGYDCGIADGIFGGGTERAVKAFQTANGLDPDGIVGPSTNAALAKDPSGFTKYLLKIGDRGESVRQLQQTLINSGYGVGISGADGIFGAATKEAVRKLQSASNLDADGIVGPNTWKALEGIKGSGTYSGLLRLGARGQGVVILQELLIKKGYSVGKYGADGVFGGGTERAVRSFQSANNLDSDGIVGPNTWEALHGEFNTEYVGGEGVEKFLNIAKSQIGYEEQPVNITKYGAWYGMQDQWCAMFVSWCAHRAGILYNVIPKYSFCADAVNWYRTRNRYARRGSYIPKPGDIIFFYDSNANAPFCHTGIVEYVEGNRVHTIEGNASDAVRRESYPISHWKIHGYGMNGGISFKGDLTQNELDKINNNELSKLLGANFSFSEKKKILFESSLIEVSYQRSGNINIGNGSAFSFSFEKGEFSGGGLRAGIANLALSLGKDGSVKLTKSLNAIYGLKFTIIAPIDGSTGIAIKTIQKINDNFSIALILNIKFKDPLDTVKRKAKEIAEELYDKFGALGIIFIIIAFIIMVLLSDGVAAVSTPEIVEIISGILALTFKKA